MKQRDVLWIVIGILLELICIFFAGSAVMAQTSTTNCFKNGAGTVCETRDQPGRTSARTTCWPQGSTGQACQTQEYPNDDRPQR